MEKKNLLTLDNEFIEYCKLNNIENINDFAKKIFKKGFDLEKYGNFPRDVKEIKEGLRNTNIKNTSNKTKKAPPPPPPKPSSKLIKKMKKDNLYDE